MTQGEKLAVGHVPLYVRGDDANARQFGSLHAVQRHMADTGRFKMAWEDNEDEYDEFYAWPEDEEADAAGAAHSLLAALLMCRPVAGGWCGLTSGKRVCCASDRTLVRG